MRVAVAVAVAGFGRGGGAAVRSRDRGAGRVRGRVVRQFAQSLRRTLLEARLLFRLLFPRGTLPKTCSKRCARGGRWVRAGVRFGS